MAFLLTFSGGASATYKDAVRVARSSQLALFGVHPIDIDGVNLVDQNRVLLYGQTAAEENGIYVYSVSGGNYTLTRALDANSEQEVLPNMLVPVSEGTVNADKIFQLITNAPFTLNVDPLTFSDVFIGLANKADRNLANLLPTSINQSLLFGDDTSYNIGAAGASRPQTLYVKTAINLNSLTASEILASDASKNITSLPTATYPSLTELSYVKGVTSALQSQLNAKVASVSGSAPISSSGGTTPSISISQSGVATDGYLSSTDWNTFNNKQAALVSGTNIKTVSGNSLLGAGDVGTIGIGYGGTGQTTANAAFNALAPAQGSNTGKYLQTDGTNTSWQTVTLLPAYSQDKVLYSTASAAEWRYVGTGSSDSTYPTGCVILGEAKPVGITGSGGQNSVLIGTSAGTALTLATPVVLINGGSALTSGGNNILIGANSNTITTGNKNVIIGNSTGAGANPANLTESVLVGEAAFGYGTANLNAVVAVGYYAIACEQGVAIGRGAKAGDFNYGAQRDVSIGYNALCYEGSDCVAIGAGASTRGPSNTVVGAGASSGFQGLDPTKAAKNVVVGKGSGYSQLSGSNNTVVGTESFNSAFLTTAANNTIVGQGNGTALTTGSTNVVIGSQSFTSATTRSGIIAIGDQTATNPTGDDLIAMGQYSGASGNGAASVAIGFRAAAGSNIWDNTVAIGNHTGYQIGQYSSAVGAQAMAIGRSNYAVGIGAYALRNGESHYSTALGYYAGNSAASYRSVFLGAYAGQNSVVNDEFYLGTVNYANNATEKTNSLMYGVFNATPASQRLTINGQVNLTQGEKHASLHGQVGTANVITATVNNYYIGVDSTLASKTVNLPAAATAGQGFVLVIKDESGTAGTNNITLQANGAETIDGANTKLIAANYGSYSLMCSGSAWFIM